MLTEDQTKWLENYLDHISKTTFIKLYSTLEQTYTDDSNEALLEIIAQEKWTDKSKNSRVSKAKRIFRDGLQLEALKIIVSSKRLDQNIVQQAKEYLEIGILKENSFY